MVIYRSKRLPEGIIFVSFIKNSMVNDGTDFPLSSESNSEADVFLMSSCWSYLMFAAFDEEIPVFRWVCLKIVYP